MKISELRKPEFTILQPVWLVEHENVFKACSKCKYSMAHVTYKYTVRKSYITGMEYQRRFSRTVIRYKTRRYRADDYNAYRQAIFPTRAEAVAYKKGMDKRQ